MASSDGLCVTTLALPVADKESPTFWTMCAFCHYVHEYLRRYENLDIWCQTCRRPFRAIAMATAPPIVPGTDSYYYWPCSPFSQSPGPPGFGGYPAPIMDQNMAMPWRHFFSSPLPSLPPSEVSNDAQKIPTEQKAVASDPSQTTHTPLPVPTMNGDSSHRPLSKKKSARAKPSNRKSGERMKIHALTTEPRVTRSKNSEKQNEHVNQHEEESLSPTKSSPIQRNVSGNARNLLVKKAKLEILKNASENQKTEKCAASSPVNSTITTTPANTTARTQKRRNDNVEQKVRKVNSSRSGKSGSGSGSRKNSKSPADEKVGEPNHLIPDDPDGGEVYEMIQGICKDIVGAEEIEEPLATSLAIDVPDSDFYNFDDDRSEYSFEEGHVWAIYDEEDGMPRIYAKIQKVISRYPFSVQIAWLQSITRTKRSCGQFKITGGTTSNVLNLFSHKMNWETLPSGGDVRIYPRRHEVWAVHDKRNSSDSEDPSRYQIVEILQEYTEEHGVSLISLVKVSGFKSVYQRVQIGSDPFVWSLFKKDLHKFSHQIPARKISEDVPELSQDCWELDPAAIPNCLLKGD
ncbi:uncharacterized protein LOC116262380 [Nymphaea colorata]|uniref:DUF3444 domain-containing protein n=1 Tax=Nymphaea colorata TaxID=210225 RepID=A0A5K0WM05_9MAGN|nr:uncharacterized protein LOC116262380 [Nymphaea colorata]XP_031497555.1 uncharacterized protein LOC116262380 [Nymphaea colorata]XP_031497556.1 uncharacterized protein LOC116262380 [Nymphaea colorata]XP_049936081.1 uncharacterized protein LOC116262380 [Nymphaea colorata]